jgi:hypothetical protein
VSYGECHNADAIMLNVIMMSVIMLKVITLMVIMMRVMAPCAQGLQSWPEKTQKYAFCSLLVWGIQKLKSYCGLNYKSKLRS